MFKDGKTNFHDEERSCRSSVVSDDLVQSVDQKIYERWHFTILELLCECPQILCSVLYEIITIRLGYHKFYARGVPEMLAGMHRTQRKASALTSFRMTPQRWP
jgi:hypothetical protein